MSKLNIKAKGRNFLKQVVGDISCEEQLEKKNVCSLNNVRLFLEQRDKTS